MNKMLWDRFPIPFETAQQEDDAEAYFAERQEYVAMRQIVRPLFVECYRDKAKTSTSL